MLTKITMTLAAVALYTASATTPKVERTFGWGKRWGHTLECNKATAVLTGACTSGGDRDCFNRQRASGIQCDHAKTKAIEHRGYGRQGYYNVWNKMAECKKHEFAYARCSSGKNKDCYANGKTVAHALWCRKNKFFKWGTSHVTVCGGRGERIECPEGTAVVASCGAGKNADCSFGECRGEGKVYTQLKCQSIVSRPNAEILLEMEEEKQEYSRKPYSPQ